MGSSPLARGLRRAHEKHIPGDRIIPARAGFTEKSGLTHLTMRDHPRSRGVYRMMGILGSMWIGSSPLARGLHESFC